MHVRLARCSVLFIVQCHGRSILLLPKEIADEQEMRKQARVDSISETVKARV